MSTFSACSTRPPAALFSSSTRGSVTPMVKKPPSNRKAAGSKGTRTMVLPADAAMPASLALSAEAATENTSGCCCGGAGAGTPTSGGMACIGGGADGCAGCTGGTAISRTYGRPGAPNACSPAKAPMPGARGAIQPPRQSSVDSSLLISASMMAACSGVLKAAAMGGTAAMTGGAAPIVRCNGGGGRVSSPSYPRICKLAWLIRAPSKWPGESDGAGLVTYVFIIIDGSLSEPTGERQAEPKPNDCDCVGMECCAAAIACAATAATMIGAESALCSGCATRRISLTCAPTCAPTVAAVAREGAASTSSATHRLWSARHEQLLASNLTCTGAHTDAEPCRRTRFGGRLLPSGCGRRACASLSSLLASSLLAAGALPSCLACCAAALRSFRRSAAFAFMMDAWHCSGSNSRRVCSCVAWSGSGRPLCGAHTHTRAHRGQLLSSSSGTPAFSKRWPQSCV
mmetsp:Transcript_8893/g.27624  ORF Transcript_8893/g.27624 Transcript_8893/m.27624 type:complete len:457 (-) Transcript_8893:93-1463(-)